LLYLSKATIEENKKAKCKRKQSRGRHACWNSFVWYCVMARLRALVFIGKIVWAEDLGRGENS
jgi:hypothetical protein